MFGRLHLRDVWKLELMGARTSVARLEPSRFFGVWVLTDRCGLVVRSRRGLDGQDVNARVGMQLRHGKARPRMFHVKPREPATEYLPAL